MGNFACSHCGSPVRDCITHYINDAGDLFRIPTKVCTSEACLMKQGTTVIRAQKREYPELRGTPTPGLRGDLLDEWPESNRRQLNPS